MEGRFNGDPYCAAVCAGCGTEWPETRVEGIGETAIKCAERAAPTRRRSRSPTATRSRSTGGSGLSVGKERAEEFAREAARYAALPGQQRPEPDPHLRAERHRRPGHPHAAVPRPVRDDAERDDARLPQRGRLRRLPDRRAAQVRDGRGRRWPRTRPTATSTSTPSAPARSSSARSRSRAAASTSATCTRCRATARSPATPPTSPARSRCRCTCSRASASTARCSSRCSRTSRSSPSR